MATATGQKLEQGTKPADLDKMPAGGRPLIGNQLRWAKQVLVETVKQIRSS